MSRFAAHPAAFPALSKSAATRQAHVRPAHCSKPNLLPQSSTRCVPLPPSPGHDHLERHLESTPAVGDDLHAAPRRAQQREAVQAVRGQHSQGLPDHAAHAEPQDVGPLPVQVVLQW